MAVKAEGPEDLRASSNLTCSGLEKSRRGKQGSLNISNHVQVSLAAFRAHPQPPWAVKAEGPEGLRASSNLTCSDLEKSSVGSREALT